MSDNIKFSYDNINQYIEKRNKVKPAQNNFKLNAVLSIFDKNADGTISKQEFDAVSKEQYEQYSSQAKDATGNQLISYSKLVEFIKNKFLNEDNAILEEELMSDDSMKEVSKKENDEAFFSDVQDLGTSSKKYEDDLSGTHGFEERFDLKDISQMTEQEMKDELAQYDIDTNGLSLIQIQNKLRQAREERIKFDKGSDEVDGKAGTYVQNQSSKYCSVLAHFASMTPEEISQMYNKEPKIDENGKKYWDVKFPIDADNDITVRITEDELMSGEITVDGVKHNDFPQGDLDATLVTMAFVKRFGNKISTKGAWTFDTGNKFRTPAESKLLDNQHMEDMDFENLPEGMVVSVLSTKEVKNKGFEVVEETSNKFSWLPAMIQMMNVPGIVHQLEDGRTAFICDRGLFLSDGTQITGAHAMATRGYDKEKSELIISGNELNTGSVVRVPKELMIYFETGSSEDTPGVRKTQQPGPEELL